MGQGAAADQPRARCRVVWRAEGALPDESMTGRKQAGHAPDGRDLDSFLEGQRGQDATQPPREHCLARAWWAQHQEIVSPGRRDLEGALGPMLAPHVREVHLGSMAAPRPATRARLMSWNL